MSDEAAAWNGAAGERWVREQAWFDAILRPFGDAAMDAARVAKGDAVIDVGCGCGDTSLALADRVGATGRVVGLDVSGPMLARARERAEGRSNVTFVHGDAAREPLPERAFDVLFSRFGVMFFADPVAAFAHLRARLRPGARLAFACWRELGANPWAGVPFEAAVAVIGRPAPEPPGSPGPFSLSAAGRAAGVLEGAGFVDVAVRVLDCTVTFGGPDVPDAVIGVTRFGPLARMLADRDRADIDRARAAVAGALSSYTDECGAVRLPASAWIVSASAP